MDIFDKGSRINSLIAGVTVVLRIVGGADGVDWVRDMSQHLSACKMEREIMHSTGSLAKSSVRAEHTDQTIQSFADLAGKVWGSLCQNILSRTIHLRKLFLLQLICPRSKVLNTEDHNRKRNTLWRCRPLKKKVSSYSHGR